MHKDRPVVRLPIVAVPGRCPGLRVLLMLLFVVGLLSITAMAAPRKGANPAGANSSQAAAAPGDFVGQETCATCHEEVAKGFAGNPHSKLAEQHGKTGVTCEGCHGPGKAHVDGGGDTTKIFNPAKATAKEVDSKCLSCHQGQHANFERTAHGDANVSCIGCHSIHAGQDKEQLLKVSQPNLCFQCHTDIRPQFDMAFHHPVNEGMVKCTDCHDVHGTFQVNNTKVAADQSMICTKCHTDVRGPFVYEHAPVKAETCLACHSPHGSQNARMLNMPNINVLCNQCHSAVGAGAIHGQGEGSSDSVPCTSCHTYIHGSNLSVAFLR